MIIDYTSRIVSTQMKTPKFQTEMLSNIYEVKSELTSSTGCKFVQSQLI